MPLITALAFALAALPQDTPALRGSIQLERPATGTRRLDLWRLQQRGGRVEAIGKMELFERMPDRTVDAAADGSFAIDLPAGSYAAFAYVDVDGDGHWTPSVPEPCAFTQRIEVGPELQLTVRAPQPLPRAEREVEHGALRWLHGLPVVQLCGDAAQRGRAHGLLLAAQIVDFFRFYVLEDRLGGAAAYAGFEAFLHTKFAWPEPMLRELDAVLAGMQQSGADLHLPELGRDFARTELLAINAYIETRAMRSSCTQFACWGERTAGTDVAGGTIAGRNMDGEIDLRRVTVSHFVLFAVTPSGQKRYVSMMWPGFVGTLSGFNEDGVHCMENAGGTGKGPVVERLQPISWTMREALATFGADATPQAFEQLLAAHGNAAGGACGPGCIIVLALPHAAKTPAWVLEGDRFGHATRLPGAAPPRLDDALLASNHGLVYGADPQRPGLSFGRDAGLSSRWRYEAGRARLEAWSRTGRKVGTAEMRELLQTVAHGSTEHSIITRPDAREFEVAVASMQCEPWDAPYRAWTRFSFAELFEAAPSRR